MLEARMDNLGVQSFQILKFSIFKGDFVLFINTFPIQIAIDPKWAQFRQAYVDPKRVTRVGYTINVPTYCLFVPLATGMTCRITLK